MLSRKIELVYNCSMEKKTEMEIVLNDNGKLYTRRYNGELAETLATRLFPNFLQDGFARRVGSLMDDVCYDDCACKCESRVKADDETKVVDDCGEELDEREERQEEERNVVDDTTDDVGATVSWYRKAAAQGNTRAQYNLGLCYFYGKGVEQDKCESVKWMCKAANNGDVQAQYHIGKCYEYACGVKEDLREALNWYRKAAKGGIEKPMERVIKRCETKLREKRDKAMDEFIAELRAKATAGDVKAQFRLAFCYHQGMGVEQDLRLASKWYRSAIEQEFGDIQTSLAENYEKWYKGCKACAETVVVDDMSDDTSCECDGCACTDDANREGKILKESCRCHDTHSERGNVNVARDASRKVSVIGRYARAAREVMDAANGILDKDCLLKLLEEKVSEDFVSPELLTTVGLTSRDVARKAIHALVDREVLEWRNLLVTRKGYTRLVRMFSEFLSQRVSENLFNTPMNIGCTYPKTWDRY